MRKYTEAKAAANKKYDNKTYKRYLISLRVDTDSGIIEEIEKCKAAGIPPTEYVRRLYQVK